jgi:TonB-dependent receptor
MGKKHMTKLIYHAAMLPALALASRLARVLLASASLVAVIPAAAQTAEPAPAEEDTEADVITVTGFKLQNQLAIRAKRDSDTTADFLAADEINRQPDYNISDAFRRAPGVFTIFDEDEGRYVGIRGFNADFTVAQFNGALIATAERGNRRVNLEQLPSSAVKRLEIFKSRTADLEGNAIGGTINLVTRSAFDSSGMYLAGSASIGYTDNQDVPGVGFGRSGNNGVSYRGEFTFTDTFAGDVFGVVLSGAYLQRRRDQQRFSAGSYSSVALNTFPTASSVIYQGYPNTIERFGGFAKIELQPTERFKLDALVSRFTQEDHELRYGQQLNLRGTQTVNGAANNFPQGQAFIRFNDFFIDKPLFTTQGHAKWEPVDGHVIKAAASYSEATFHEPSNEILFTTANSLSALGGSYVFQDLAPVITVNDPAFFGNAANYPFTSYIFYEQFSDDFVEEYSADYSYNRALGDRGFGVDAGVQLRDNRRVFDEDRSTFRLNAGNTLDARNFVRSEPFTGPFNQYNQLLLDGGPFLNFFNANRSLFNETISNTAADYIFDERVFAAYGQLAYRGDRFNILAGVRYEATDTLVERQRSVSGAVTRVERTNSYDNWLPSITGYFDITDRLRLRTSWFKAVGRPNPIDLAGSETVTTGGDGIPQLARGNPDLQAREADSFDASLEYYLPGDSGLIAFAVFHKDITNEIFRFQDDETIDGVLTRVTQPRNVSQARLTGFELSLVLNNLGEMVGFLPGLGVSSNFSFFDGKVDVVGIAGVVLREVDQLLQQPKTVFNAALFYNRGPFESRVTFARSSSFPTAISSSAVADTDRIDDVYSQLDWTGRLNLTEQLQLTAEVRNLANYTRSNLQTNPFGNAMQDFNIYGRTYFAGIAFKF